MMVSNASGCSSVYSGSAPSTPYTKNCHGKDKIMGIIYYLKTMLSMVGMHVGVEALRDRLQNIMETSIDDSSRLTELFNKSWIENKLCSCN